MRFAARLAGAVALDAAFLAGRVIGSFLAGAEQALDRTKKPNIEYVPGVGYVRN